MAEKIADRLIESMKQPFVIEDIVLHLGGSIEVTTLRIGIEVIQKVSGYTSGARDSDSDFSGQPPAGNGLSIGAGRRLEAACRRFFGSSHSIR